MGYSIKHAYNGWAALAAAVLAGCSSTSKPTAQEREEAFAENQRISAGVRQTFANTQRQPQTQAPIQAPAQAVIQSKVQAQFQNVNTRLAQAPVPFELDPRDYAPDSKPSAPPQIRPIVATVAATPPTTPFNTEPNPTTHVTTNTTTNITSKLAFNPLPAPTPAPAAAPTPTRAPARLTLATADSDAASTLPVPIDLVDGRAAKIVSAQSTPATPQNAAPTSSAPETAPGLTVDASGNLKSFTLRRPPSAAFLAAPNTLRSVTIDRLGHVVAWEPVNGPTRASGLIRKNVVTDPKSPYVELVAQPNPNARSESAHPGLVFTPLADGSLVYTCE